MSELPTMSFPEYVSSVAELLGEQASNSYFVCVTEEGGDYASWKLRLFAHEDGTALEDNGGGTPGAFIEYISDGENAGSADVAQTRNAVAKLAESINEIRSALRKAGIMTTPE